jgi:hypothetical protein
VIPTSWTPVHRPADAERVGYLSPDGVPIAVVPRLLTGAPAGPVSSPGVARDLLVRRGLALLDRRWWCRLPVPLTDGTDAARPDDDWAWSAVVLVEASPDGCRVRLEYAEPAELRAQALLPVPVGDLLLEHPPEE